MNDLLTKESIPKILSVEPLQRIPEFRPILLVKDARKIIESNIVGAAARWKLILTDGDNDTTAMLGYLLSDRADSGELTNNCLLELTDYYTLSDSGSLNGKIIIVVKANVVGKFDGDHSTKKRKREEEEEVAVGSIDVEFVQMIGEKLGEKMVMVDAVDLGDTKGDVLAVLRASAADAFGCSPNDVGEMRSRLDGEDALTLLNDAGLVKRLRSMAQVRVVLRDARDAEIDKLRAEMLLLEQNNKSAAGSGVPAAAEPPSPPAPASAPAPAPAPAVPSVSSKSLQRLAVESLFTPVSHQNTAEIMTLCDELGLDSSNVESTEAILLYMDTSHLQRLAARLKVGPQGLFKKAFLATSLVPLGVEEEQLQQPPSPPRNSANRGEVDAIERNRIRIRNIMKTHRRSQSASS